MAPLHESLRRALERQVVLAREVAERGAEAALSRLAVTAREPHAHLTPDERELRNRLRARGRALGDPLRAGGVQTTERLAEEVAYEAWHRMLFARFLVENHLLVHPEHGVPVSLAECEELAAEEGAEDKWVLAARYAARMLPQIFRSNDPSLQVSFAPEHRVALERLVEELAPDVFRADDSLGWVYQFWQAKRKDEVNAAGEPITGETLPAVTQLFTEPYMVSFLLENTIGAWWSARHPGEPLPVEMPYLRRLEDGTPAAGAFEGWPKKWHEFTLLDPCCGSGHFLVAALRLLVPLRMRDEGLAAAEAVDAVLGENLYGLELDARCTQIAAFAVALTAWTTLGATGYRPLPELQIACSGLAVGAKKEEWLVLAGRDQKLEAALGKLYDLFKLAPELGSLIDPTEDRADLLTASFAEVAPLLVRALQSERVKRDDEMEATAVTAQGIAKAAALLGRKYTLISTNVPYLGRGKQGSSLQDYLSTHYSAERYDLAYAFFARARNLALRGGAVALVGPQAWLFSKSALPMREQLLRTTEFSFVARLGAGAFATIGGAIVNVALVAWRAERPKDSNRFFAIAAEEQRQPSEKAVYLVGAPLSFVDQKAQLANPESRVVLESISASGSLLSEFAESYQGLVTGDINRFVRSFWELARHTSDWVPLRGASDAGPPWAGISEVLLWQQGQGALADYAHATRDQLHDMHESGNRAWGRTGVAINRVHNLRAALYRGEAFHNNVAVLVPKDKRLLPALWAYCSSDEFFRDVRRIDQKLSLTNQTLLKVRFDESRWTAASAGLPERVVPLVNDWYFDGDLRSSATPLHTAVAKLLGYNWPSESVDHNLASFVDSDGLVCLPAVRGEMPATERLNALLAASYGKVWSPVKRDELLARAGFEGRALDQWLQDGFFEQHCRLFHQRPFVWHITDKAKSGFSALVNYHKLDRKTLETLTFTYLGDWISRQEEARKRDERGADVKLAAAKGLQHKLRLILEGEPPYDIFVRWKPLHEQPIGWEPDLNDGVRVNIWPFVQAGVLRARVNVNWKKDRGKNPPGGPWGEDRYNRYEDIPRADRPADLRNVEHLTNDLKRAARNAHESSQRPTATKKPASSQR
jgi:hypothetical protein